MEKDLKKDMGKDKEPKEQKEQPEIKKCSGGFLCKLMYVFLAFVVLLAIFSGVFYFKKDYVTTNFLKLTSKPIINGLLQNYDYEKDQTYNQKADDKERNEYKDQLKKQINEAFEKALEKYQKSTNKVEWRERFDQILKEGEKILSDRKREKNFVSPEEFQELVNRVNEVTNKEESSSSEESPKEEPQKNENEGENK